jgi:hypothetical protein
MLTWAGAGWAETRQNAPVAIVRILSVRMVVAFELVEPRLDLTGFLLWRSKPFGLFYPLSLTTKQRPQDLRDRERLRPRSMHCVRVPRM